MTDVIYVLKSGEELLDTFTDEVTARNEYESATEPMLTLSKVVLESDDFGNNEVVASELLCGEEPEIVEVEEAPTEDSVETYPLDVLNQWADELGIDLIIVPDSNIDVWDELDATEISEPCVECDPDGVSYNTAFENDFETGELIDSNTENIQTTPEEATVVTADVEEDPISNDPVNREIDFSKLVEELEENEDTVECGWCNELFDKSECRKEVDLGYLCPQCEAAIKSRGEELTFKEACQKEVTESIDENTIEDVEEFIKETKAKFPEAEVIYDGDTNTVKITLDGKVSEALLEAAFVRDVPSTDQYTPGVVDMIKAGYNQGKFDGLNCKGRKNRCYASLSGPDKDRLIGFFDKKPEFEREDHSDSGIFSTEFISDKYDIEIFDDFMSVYQLNEALTESLNESIEEDVIYECPETKQKLIRSNNGYAIFNKSNVWCGHINADSDEMAISKFKKNQTNECLNESVELEKIKNKFYSANSPAGHLWKAVDLTDDEMQAIGKFGWTKMNDNENHSYVQLSDKEYKEVFGESLKEDLDDTLSYPDKDLEINYEDLSYFAFDRDGGEHEVFIKYTFKVDAKKVIDEVLVPLVVKNNNIIDSDEALAYCIKNYDILTDKYESAIADYFEEEAQEEADENVDYAYEFESLKEDAAFDDFDIGPQADELVDGVEVAASVEDEEVNYDKLIDEEKDAIDSYEEQIGNSGRKDERELLKHIQDEEREHVKELKDAKEGNFKDESAENKGPLNESNTEDAEDFEIIENRLVKYNGNTPDVVIPDNVTSIGSGTFQGCTEITGVTIPDSVTDIEDGAFYGCAGLTDLSIPNSVTNIGSSAFYGCTGLTSVTLGDNVANIGSEAFEGCTGLTSITIPDSVTNIENSTFAGCTELKSVMIPDSVASIGDWAFWGCNKLESVTISNNLKNIGDEAFYNCTSLVSIAIPNSLTSIGYRAFWNCDGLTDVTIPNNVTDIGVEAFKYCSNLIITCNKGSHAEEYAKDQDIPTEYLN